MLEHNEKIAIIAITKNGIDISTLIKNKIPQVVVFAPDKLKSEIYSNIIWFTEPVSKIIKDQFKSNDALICIFSLGAVIRLISNLLIDKKTDPAVLVIDDKATFVISTLSGHLGGANALAKFIASFLNSIPVITTAADVNKTIAVDLLGTEFGWQIENFTNVTKTSAFMVNEEEIAVFQDSGEKHWWNIDNLPKNVTIVNSLQQTLEEKFKACLIITDKLITNKNILSKSVIYRPKSLVVGIGVHWDTTEKEIFDGITSVLAKNMLSFSSIKALTSIKKKIDVKGLSEFSKEHKIPLYLYDQKELDKINVPNPSDIVKKYEKVPSVAEASSLLHSSGSLVVEKQKFPPNLTIAISKVGLE